MEPFLRTTTGLSLEAAQQAIDTQSPSNKLPAKARLHVTVKKEVKIYVIEEINQANHSANNPRMQILSMPGSGTVPRAGLY